MTQRSARSHGIRGHFFDRRGFALTSRSGFWPLWVRLSRREHLQRAPHHVQVAKRRTHRELGTVLSHDLVAELGTAKHPPNDVKGGGAACAEARTTLYPDERSTHHRALLQHQSLVPQQRVDALEDRALQIVRFEQVAQAQDGALIGHDIHPDVDAHELAHERHVVEGLFHRRVRQIEPLLQAVNAQQRLHRKRRACALGAGLRGVGLDDGDQLSPGHDAVHLLKKDATARGLAAALERGNTGEAELLHGRCCPARRGIWLGGGVRYAAFSN